MGWNNNNSAVTRNGDGLTMQAVLDVVISHVDKDTAKAIFSDLRNVPGNSIFHTTIIKLEQQLEKM